MTPQPEYIKVVLTVPLKEWKHLRTAPGLNLDEAQLIANGVVKEIQKQEPEFYICPSCKEYKQQLSPQMLMFYCNCCYKQLTSTHKVTNFHQLIAGNC